MFVKNQIVAFAPETLVNGVQLASSARVKSVIHSYRDMLYIFRDSQRGGDSTKKSSTAGNYRDESVLLRILRYLQHCMKHKDRDGLYIEGQAQVTEALNLMKAECDLLQKLWNAQRELLSIMDTLLQCTSRIQLATPSQYVDAQEHNIFLKVLT